MTHPAGTKVRQRTPKIQMVGQERPEFVVRETLPDGQAVLSGAGVTLLTAPEELARDWEPVPEAPPLTDQEIAETERATMALDETLGPAWSTVVRRLIAEVLRLRALPTVAQSAASALPEAERQGGQKVAEAVTSHVQRKP